MAEHTNISWTNHTHNPWIGCQKVSAGCDNCYAEALTERYGWTQWGPHGVRKRTSAANWRKPLAWNKAAQAAGQRRRVFCASLADVFDNQAPPGARDDLFDLIRQTPMLDWQLLSKRPENMDRCLPNDWPLVNAWLGVTAENQDRYNHRWRILREIPAAVRFISYEPAIGPVSIGHDTLPDWIIIGGESGPGARTMNPAWARQVKDECLTAQVPVFMKQWGVYRSNPLVYEDDLPIHEAKRMDPPANGKGGALLDGALWRKFPC